MADSGKNVQEDIAIGGNSNFSSCSTKFISAIVSIKSKAA
jgi:hypothetical protein